MEVYYAFFKQILLKNLYKIYNNLKNQLNYLNLLRIKNNLVNIN